VSVKNSQIREKENDEEDNKTFEKEEKKKYSNEN
jgi:hypothetical protein